MTQKQAMLAALMAFFCWVGVDTLIKLGSQASLSPFIIMAVLGLVGAFGIMTTSIIKGKVATLRPVSWRAQALIAVCTIINNFVLVISLKHLPLTVFYIVVFTQPLVIAGLSVLLKHEILTRIKILCLISGFIGVVIAVGPQTSGNGEWIGYLAALSSVAVFALSTVAMRKLSKTDSAASIQFSSLLSVGFVGLAGAVQADIMPAYNALLMIGVAGLVNMVGSILYTKALHHTASTNVAQLHYTQIISGAAVGYLIWQEVPTWNLVLGGIIIVASGMIVAAHAHKTDVAAQPIPGS